MQSATPGQTVGLNITADVTILLTAATWGVVSDLTDGVLHVYALNDGGTLKWGVHQDGSRNLVLGSEDSVTPGDINTSAECLVNSALGTDSQALHIGYFKANFDLTGGAAEVLWAIQTADQDIGVGIHPQLNSEQVVHSGNAHGSTNNKIRIFTTNSTSRGSAILYSTSAAAGNLFIINEHGKYAMTYNDTDDTGASAAGITVNSASLTTAVVSIAQPERIALNATPAVSTYTTTTIEKEFNIGDHIRAHTNGDNDATVNQVQFTIVKTGN